MPNTSPALADLLPAFRANSPRHAAISTPLASLLIHGGVLALWILLVLAAFMLGGLFAWSVGLAYIVYDTLLLVFVGWQARVLLRTRVRRSRKSSAPCSLGVIVAAYNEAAILPLSLQNLLSQSDAPDLIVIADDGSNDGTAALLAEHYGLVPPALGELSAPSRDYPSLRWLRLPRGGKARALNAAALQANCEVLLTVDADTLLDARAVGAFRRAFSVEPLLTAATGVLAPVCGGSLAGRCFQWFQTYEYVRNFISRFAWMRLDSLLLISGAFAGFRREALLAVGGFDDNCFVEDYEVIHRLRRYAQMHGRVWRFRVLGGAQAQTDAPATIGAFLRQRRRWFGGFLQTQYWYRAMVGDSQYGWLGRLMLPVKAVDTLQPIYGLTAFVLLVDYLLTGRFAVLWPVAAVISLKIAIDLAFHLYSLRLYRRWVGESQRTSIGAAILAALLEPFSFQLLRHSGAAWGWWTFLTNSEAWGHGQRRGLASAEATAGEG